jgi:hypothetical protein
MALYVVEERKHRRWSVTVRAEGPEHARSVARACGLTEPATVRPATPDEEMAQAARAVAP